MPIRLAGVLAMGLALGLAGCATGNADTPDYRAGFADGCASAGQPNAVRNAGQFANNADYHAGWLSGRNACASGQPETRQ